MVKKMKKYVKFVVCMALIMGLIAPSYAALSASDGSAFVTKAEFDSALADFNARLTTFEAGINSKIDSQVTSYLDRNGIWNGKTQTIHFSSLDIPGQHNRNQVGVIKLTEDTCHFVPRSLIRYDYWNNNVDDGCYLSYASYGRKGLGYTSTGNMTYEEMTFQQGMLWAITSFYHLDDADFTSYNLTSVMLYGIRKLQEWPLVDTITKSGLCMIKYDVAPVNNRWNSRLFWQGLSGDWNDGLTYIPFIPGFQVCKVQKDAQGSYPQVASRDYEDSIAAVLPGIISQYFLDIGGRRIKWDWGKGSVASGDPLEYASLVNDEGSGASTDQTNYWVRYRRSVENFLTYQPGSGLLSFFVSKGDRLVLTESLSNMGALNGQGPKVLRSNIQYYNSNRYGGMGWKLNVSVY